MGEVDVYAAPSQAILDAVATGLRRRVFDLLEVTFMTLFPVHAPIPAAVAGIDEPATTSA